MTYLTLTINPNI